MTETALECPECGYNLRGLSRTSDLTCPECGEPCEINWLLAYAWLQEKGRSVPGMDRLTGTVTTSVITMTVAFIMAILYVLNLPPQHPRVMLEVSCLAMVFVAFWVWMVWRLAHSSIPRLSLRMVAHAHLIFAMIMMGLLGIPIIILSIVVDAPMFSVVAIPVGTGFALLFLLVAFRNEKRLRSRCIRRYLDELPHDRLASLLDEEGIIQP